MSSEIKVDTISENTSANGVSIDSVTLKDGGIDLADSKALRLGTGNDLTISFDGTDSVMDHTPGSGGLYIRSDAILMQDSQSTPNQFVRMDQGSGVTFNDGSLDHDFRVESNGAAYALFVDGGNDRVDVGRAGSGSGTTDAGSTIFTTGQQYYFTSSNSATQVNRFYNSDSGAQIGNITMSSSATAYVTSSDYRLKENVDYDWDATTRLKQLKPARFNWIADDTNTLVDGFLAHEVSSVVPEAVTGDKDATETYTDENGAEQTRIDPQGIDQAKLVPLMVKTIQEAMNRIETLEAEVSALKGE